MKMYTDRSLMMEKMQQTNVQMNTHIFSKYTGPLKGAIILPKGSHCTDKIYGVVFIGSYSASINLQGEACIS